MRRNSSICGLQLHTSPVRTWKYSVFRIFLLLNVFRGQVNNPANYVYATSIVIITFLCEEFSMIRGYVSLNFILDWSTTFHFLITALLKSDTKVFRHQCVKYSVIACSYLIGAHYFHANARRLPNGTFTFHILVLWK